jgi:two-component system phosphate regulon response regulator PhoB
MPGSRPTVLICDDAATLRELARASLGDGYRFLEATTVAEAEEALKRRRPDVVLLDLMLPGGSGIDVLQTVRRRRGARIPVVVVSAWSSADHRRSAVEAGADAFVAKPFVPERLAAAVAGLLEAK